MNISEEQIERFAQVAEKANNLLGSLALPLPPHIHLSGCRSNIEEMRDELRDKCRGKGRRGGGRCFACTGTGVLTCNRSMCASCAAHVEGEDRDYCPLHRVAAGFKLRREPCEWAQADTTAKCIHKGCEEVVVEGERCLWFKKRRRPMCLECGAKYLEASE
jgi:hypothetical protein